VMLQRYPHPLLPSSLRIVLTGIGIHCQDDW
jgi:hypothetical protein